MKFNRETESGYVYNPVLIGIAVISFLYAAFGNIVDVGENTPTEARYRIEKIQE